MVGKFRWKWNLGGNGKKLEWWRYIQEERVVTTNKNLKKLVVMDGISVYEKCNRMH